MTTRHDRVACSGIFGFLDLGMSPTSRGCMRISWALHQRKKEVTYFVATTVPYVIGGGLTSWDVGRVSGPEKWCGTGRGGRSGVGVQSSVVSVGSRGAARSSRCRCRGDGVGSVGTQGQAGGMGREGGRNYVVSRMAGWSSRWRRNRAVSVVGEGGGRDCDGQPWETSKVGLVPGRSRSSCDARLMLRCSLCPLSPRCHDAAAAAAELRLSVSHNT
jgi:hypothetical protein